LILRKILKRVKKLYKTGYPFQQEPYHFYSLFEGNVTVKDYLKQGVHFDKLLEK